MVRTIATATDTAKRQVIVEKVLQGCIDANPATGGVVKHVIGCILILRVHVKCQRLVAHTVDLFNCILNAICRDDWEHWSEDLLRQKGLTKLGILHDGRRDELGVRIDGIYSPHDHLTLCLTQETANPAHVIGVDDAPKVWTLLYVLPEQTLGRGPW
eukprot:CAMPEP_0185907944 /NCGR_PEP_ID=MMETSP0196C-20130402/7949_1 /TAXON_ID=2932 /ORGANISM="Alexandrium fundyense, Strain CCMP1719" /LENGTH=156 /DNA_ID=CAMNT_0028628051 /DNA_START=26 /DNA_END=493 /DNA_ORIENTATION=+